MPFTAVCPTHPDAAVLYPDEFFLHAKTEHVGESLQMVHDQLERGYQSQVEAHGRPTKRIIHCRSCATAMTFEVATEAEGADLPVLCPVCRD